MLKNTTTEKKNLLEVFKIRLDQAKESHWKQFNQGNKRKKRIREWRKFKGLTGLY